MGCLMEAAANPSLTLTLSGESLKVFIQMMEKLAAMNGLGSEKHAIGFRYSRRYKLDDVEKDFLENIVRGFRDLPEVEILCEEEKPIPETAILAEQNFSESSLEGED